jgi:sulfur-carrier protein
MHGYACSWNHPFAEDEDMSTLISIAAPFRKLTGGLGKLEVEARDIEEVIAGMESRFPGIRACVLDSEGRVLPHVIIFLNETDIQVLKGLSTLLQPGDEVAIVPAIAGG